MADVRSLPAGRPKANRFTARLVGRPRLDGKPTAVPVKLVVDHCHQSRQIRGLLCVGGNAAIGHFADDETALWAAVRYLRSTTGREIVPPTRA